MKQTRNNAILEGGDGLCGTMRLKTVWRGLQGSAWVLQPSEKVEVAA